VPEIITCPQCQRKLRMDESVLGQTVQCPSCQNTFIAERPAAVAPPAARPVDDEPPVYRTRDEDPPSPPRRYPTSRPPRYEEEDEDYPRPPRRSRYHDDYPRSHRGSAVLTLGILGLVLSLTGLLVVPGVILAIIAVVLGASDLAAMSRGEVDPAGRGSTKSGLICGIIALTLVGLGVVTCIGINVLDNL
jgi:hypothetical protein